MRQAARLTAISMAILLTANVQPLTAQQPNAEQIKFFETHIRPAFAKYCYQCHSVEAGDSRAGLLVDSKQGLLQGGDNGPAIVPGNPDESLIWEAINWDGFEMPPSQKMPASVIEKFKQWIEMGAPDPRERELLTFKTKITPQDIDKSRAEHWAFQAPKPQSDVTIDSLIEKKLAQEGLKAARPADAFTLLRRINFDLIGLPPSPSEVSKFHAAYSANPDAAVKAKVDELLARKQYGERWGRHWLDVARYAESSGSRNVSYPHAWRYRDYVIDSFNDDTPYDRFVAEQIAGDLLPVKTDEQWQENLIATGFLAIGMKHHDEKNPRKFMADMVDEQIDTMTQAVLGLTVACARCHDHKYDPIPTNDYYALAGIFYSTKTHYGTLRIGQNHRPGTLLLLPMADKSQDAQMSQQNIGSIKTKIAQLDREMAGMRGKDRRQIRNVRNRLAGQLAAFNPDGSAKSFGMGAQEGSEMVNANILISGEVDKPAQEVPRGFVQILGDLNFSADNGKASGRMELAKALTSKSNPLTARVMVNRIWMHLVGRPLVETPSNFGLSGMQPNNQELLDHLAVRFMSEDWSVKTMIREIVMSDAYRRSSAYSKANYAVDPDNKMNWRANPRQIDAEALRDAMLALSGRLDLERPSKSAISENRPGGPDQDANDNHRSVYLKIVRDRVPAALDLFDFPDPNISSPSRSESIVPTQALYMMNGEFITAQAEAMANKIQQHHKTVQDQVRMAFILVYGRPATREEYQASADFFAAYQPGQALGANPNARPPQAAQRRGNGRAARPGRQRQAGPDAGNRSTTANNQTLAVFCQTLMASASFRILN